MLKLLIVNLTVDIGNTHIKLVSFLDNKIIEKNVLNNIIEIPEYIKRSNIRHVISSSVQGNKYRWNKYLKDIYHLNLTYKTLLPIKIKYKSIQTLGNDRIALAVAANILNPNLNSLIIDCGTCITYDFVNTSNEYIGGSISPGLQMRFKSLKKYTANLPLSDSNSLKKIIGLSTKSSISSGVINGIIAELNGIILRYKEEYPNLKIFLTGGDMNLFANKIKNNIFADSYLLAKGLNFILDYNVKK